MKKVLLIDDDEITNYINSNILKKFKVKDIVATNDGVEALQYLIENCKYKGKCPPDLILLDMQMPVIGGIEFLKVVHKVLKKHKTKVIILTGMEKDELKQKDELTSLPILEKPLTEEALKKEILTA